jgi:hypothetical protein
MILFIVKIVIAALGLCLALVNFVKYMEDKDKQRLWRAAIFFFGTWAILVLIKVVAVWVFKM